MPIASILISIVSPAFIHTGCLRAYVYRKFKPPFLHALTVPPAREAISDQFARCFVKIPLSIGLIGRCVDASRRFGRTLTAIREREAVPGLDQSANSNVTVTVRSWPRPACRDGVSRLSNAMGRVCPQSTQPQKHRQMSLFAMTVMWG